jgi:hypothetical protein
MVAHAEGDAGKRWASRNGPDALRRDATMLSGYPGSWRAFRNKAALRHGLRCGLSENFRIYLRLFAAAYIMFATWPSRGPRPQRRKRSSGHNGENASDGIYRIQTREI